MYMYACAATLRAFHALPVRRRQVNLHDSACRVLNSPWRQDLRRQTYPHLGMKHDPSWQTFGESYTRHRKHAIVNVEVCFSLARDLRSDIDGLAIKQHLLSLPCGDRGACIRSQGYNGPQVRRLKPAFSAAEKGFRVTLKLFNVELCILQCLPFTLGKLDAIWRAHFLQNGNERWVFKAFHGMHLE